MPKAMMYYRDSYRGPGSKAARRNGCTCRGPKDNFKHQPVGVIFVSGNCPLGHGQGDDVWHLPLDYKGRIKKAGKDG